MAVIAVTSNYNVRRRKQSVGATPARLDESPRLNKRVKVEKRSVFTPPASPEASDIVQQQQQQVQERPRRPLHEDDDEDAVLVGVFDFMQRNGGSAMCSREISEGLLAEGRVQLSGATPSTLVDAAIRQHHRRCTAGNRANVIRKVADPRFPRKTLYHLADVDPFAPRVTVVPTPEASLAAQSPADTATMAIQGVDDGDNDDRQDEESDASDCESEASHRRRRRRRNDGSIDIDTDIDTDGGRQRRHGAQSLFDQFSDDGQGPFAASLDTRRRMSLSPSPELEFSLHIDDDNEAAAAAARRTVATPVASVPSSPAAKEQLLREQRRQRLKIDAPPSPFVTPRHGADGVSDREGGDDDPVVALDLSDIQPFAHYPSTRTRAFPRDDLLHHHRHHHYHYSHDNDDDLDGIDVQSPEAVSLDDLDCLFGF